MSRVGGLELSEVGVAAADGLREILSRSLVGETTARYVEQEPLSWQVVRDGGWDLLGAPESADGAGASLRDLVEVARVWGESIVPLPLVATIMAKRWSHSARDYDGPVSMAIRTRASGDKSVVPFGGQESVRLLSETGESGELTEVVGPTADEYAPSLRLVECEEVTTFSAETANELRVIWSAEASGCSTRMLADAIAYVKEREQFGQPVGRFQAVKHHLANAHLLNEQAETAVILASLERERAAAASRFAFDASLQVIEIAIQVHGGLGFTWEMGLHMYMRHVSALRELASGLPS